MGDVSFSHFKGDTICYDNEITRVLENGDLNVCNLENPVCDTSLKHKAKPIVLGSQKLPRLVLKHFTAFSLANNHAMDYMDSGLRQTICYLSRNQKLYFGAGENIQLAMKPLTINSNEHRVAIWGITRFENAGKNRPGTANDQIKYYFSAIDKYKSKGYFTIFYVHWGREYVDYPTQDDKKMARKLIERGVDCVVGTHPHVSQGIDYHLGKYIFYSLGNFIFSDNVMKQVAFDENDSRIEQGYILRLSINDDNTYEPSIIPYQSVNGFVSHIAGDRLISFTKNVKTISYQTYNSRQHEKLFYSSATSIRKQSSRMVKQQINKHGIRSLFDALRKVRIQDLRILLYPNLEERIVLLRGNGLIARIYRIFINKFVSFSIIGLMLSVLSILTLGILLGICGLPIFPTWWIVYILSIIASLALNSKYVFDSTLSVKNAGKFILCYLSSMLLGTVIISITRNSTDLPNWIVGYTALPFTIIYNFVVLQKILSTKDVILIEEEHFKRMISGLVLDLAQD